MFYCGLWHGEKSRRIVTLNQIFIENFISEGRPEGTYIHTQANSHTKFVAELHLYIKFVTTTPNFQVRSIIATALVKLTSKRAHEPDDTWCSRCTANACYLLVYTNIKGHATYIHILTHPPYRYRYT